MKKNNHKLPNDISLDEILSNIDSKIQDIESGKSKTSITKTRIDGVDVKDIIKKIDTEAKKIEEREKNDLQ